MPQVLIKFREEDLKAIEDKAKREHLRTATYCRKIILDHVLGDKLPSNDTY